MEEKQMKIKKSTVKLVPMPLMMLKGLCVYPNTEISIEMARPAAVSAVNAAAEGDCMLFLVAQKYPELEEADLSDLYEIGTVCRLMEYTSFPNGRHRVIVQGLYRGIIQSSTYTDSYYTVKIKKLPTKGKKHADTMEYQAQKQIILDQMEAYRTSFHEPDGAARRLSMIFDGESFSFNAANTIELPFPQKQKLLEESDLKTRLNLMVEYIRYQLELIQTINKVNMGVQETFNQQQKEAYIREEIRLLREELGDSDSEEIEEYRRKLAEGNFTEENRIKLEKDISRLERMNPMQPDSQVLRSYLDFVFELPWGITTEESDNISRARCILDRDHYGMDRVKQRILEYLAVKSRRTDGKVPIICLYGPPGVGKTSVAKSIAEAMNKKYVRMSLGGIHDEADIRGHRKTYIGAMPGRIITAIKQVGTSNPLILLDEIDKLGKDIHGDPAAALLEVLDGEQNFSFRDHYLELPFDLSKVTFITTANSLDSVSGPLKDRMEIIEITGYSAEEKLEIARRYLLPKQLKAMNLEAGIIKISDAILEKIIWEYTAESGVRQLERILAAIIRKAILEITENGRKTITVNERLLKKYLGPSKRNDDESVKEDKVGVAGGLAWTAVGGVSLSVEVNSFPGTGQLELTGSLGTVMKESAKAALSYIRSHTQALGIPETFYKTKDIHIHVPEGAIPKDGPSAGITMATALVSALTGRPVRHDVAMTGEITLLGDVLPIGGLKEKSLAALRKGVKTIILPEGNRKNEGELPISVKGKMKIVYVRNIEQVLKEALR